MSEPNSTSAPLYDPWQRRMTYLRVSVTDRCNLRCTYCMPAEGMAYKPRAELLSYEELLRVISLCAQMGFTKLRLTGGEPLVRRDFVELVRQAAAMPGIRDLGMTTNGVLLGRYVDALRLAGLRRINISIDSLRRDRFARIARQDSLREVWRAIEAAVEAGFEPVKLNVVVLGGVNDDEILDFVGLTRDMPLVVRFIERMPLGEAAVLGAHVPAHEILARVRREHELVASPGDDPAAAARTFRIPGHRGAIGVISPMSHKFCSDCNRMRLSAEGKLKSCLLSNAEVDLRAAIRAGADDAALRVIFEEAAGLKGLTHGFDTAGQGEIVTRGMSQIGG